MCRLPATCQGELLSPRLRSALSALTGAPTKPMESGSPRLLVSASRCGAAWSCNSTKIVDLGCTIACWLRSPSNLIAPKGLGWLPRLFGNPSGHRGRAKAARRSVATRPRNVCRCAMSEVASRTLDVRSGVVGGPELLRSRVSHFDPEWTWTRFGERDACGPLRVSERPHPRQMRFLSSLLTRYAGTAGYPLSFRVEPQPCALWWREWCSGRYADHPTRRG